MQKTNEYRDLLNEFGEEPITMEEHLKFLSEALDTTINSIVATEIECLDVMEKTIREVVDNPETSHEMKIFMIEYFIGHYLTARRQKLHSTLSNRALDAATIESAFINQKH